MKTLVVSPKCYPSSIKTRLSKKESREFRVLKMVLFYSVDLSSYFGLESIVTKETELLIKNLVPMSENLSKEGNFYT